MRDPVGDPLEPSTPLRPAPQSLGEHVSRTFRLAAPVMLGRAGVLMMTIVDTAMCGWASAESLAAFGVSAAPQITMLVIGIGVLVGTVVLAAQADGAGRTVDCGRTWHAGLLIGCGLGLVFSLVMLNGDLVFDLVDPDPAIRAEAEQAFRAFAWGMPGVLMFVATTLFLEGIGRSVPGMVVTLAANLVNAFLNWVLIFGHLGADAMGAEGANLSTSITRWAMVAAIVCYALTMRDGARFGVRGAAPADGGGSSQSPAQSPATPLLHVLRRLVRLGIPLSAATLFESTAFMMLAVFAARMGAMQAAAYQIMLNLLAVVFMLGIGLSTATGVRVGNAVGRRDAGGLRVAGWVGCGINMAIMIVVAPAVWLLERPIIALFSTEPSVVAFAAQMMPVIAIAILFDSLQTVANGALRGTGDVMVPAAIFALAFWGVSVPVAWWLGRHLDWGPVGLIWAIVAGVFLASILLLLRFQVVSRRTVRAVS